MKDFESYPEVTEALPDALAAVSPHRLPIELRARVLRAAEARAGRAGRQIDLRTALRGMTAVVVVTALVGVTVWNVELQQALAQEQSLLQQLRDKARQQPVVFDVVDSPASQKALLRAVGPRRVGEDAPYGKLYTNPGFTQVVVMAGRLPDPASYEEYRLYLTWSTGAVVLVGTLPVDASGFGYLVFDSGVRGPSYTTARLYLQPRGGNGLDGVLTLSWETR